MDCLCHFRGGRFELETARTFSILYSDLIHRVFYALYRGEYHLDWPFVAKKCEA